MRKAIGLIHTSEINILLNLSLIMLLLINLMIFIYAKALVMVMLFSEQARGRPWWSMPATWCPRAPCWWPLV